MLQELIRNLAYKKTALLLTYRRFGSNFSIAFAWIIVFFLLKSSLRVVRLCVRAYVCVTIAKNNSSWTDDIEEIKVNFQILLDDLWSDEDDACKDLVSKLLSKNPSGQQPTLHYGAKI